MATDSVKTIRLLLNEQQFHAVLGTHALAAHGHTSWRDARVSTLFTWDSSDRLLQVRVEVDFSPVPDQPA